MTTPRQLHLFCARCGDHYSGAHITELCPPCHLAAGNTPRIAPHIQRRLIGPTPLIQKSWTHFTFRTPRQKATS